MLTEESIGDSYDKERLGMASLPPILVSQEKKKKVKNLKVISN